MAITLWIAPADCAIDADQMTASDPSVSEQSPSPSVPWLLATADDIASVDIDVPLKALTCIDGHYLSEAYGNALTAYRHEDGSLEDCAEVRVFGFLGALTSMMLRPTHATKPFVPQMVLADGRSTAVPENFRARLDVLEAVALRTQNLGLRARASDVSWLLKRSNATMGFSAVRSYNEIVMGFQNGEITHPHVPQLNALTFDSRDVLLRALQIGKALGFDKPECAESRSLVQTLRQQALASQFSIPAMWFSELDLEFAISEPISVGRDLEGMASAIQEDNYLANQIWQLAAKAYHYAKLEDEKNRCKVKAANRLVAEAEARADSAMAESHFYTGAIAQLSHVPGQKELRAHLIQKLVKTQENVIGEMKIASVEVDLTEPVEFTRQAFQKGTLLQKLLSLSIVSKSPSIDDLRNAAIKSLEENPLSSIIPTQHVDREGKVIFRSDKGSTAAGIEAAIVDAIYRNESMRRKIVVAGEIEVARREIVLRHYISDDLLVQLLELSPAIPPELIYTFAHGFADFLHGDYVSATYILTPLLESSLRCILKKGGHEVTILFDDSLTQEDISLSQLFGKMEKEITGILGSAMVQDLHRVFVMKPGPHLRHALAHGLLSDHEPFGWDAIYGCWLIFRLCMLPLIAAKEEVYRLLKDTELVTLA